MYGIYARQSVERQDSISIEMQIELCKKRLPTGEECEVYTDRGCTGTNTRRHEYRRMVGDIRTGRLSGIIVYKLDRISRSLLDFARLSEELSKHHVKLCSCSEELDSSSPMGQMIIRLLIMFAEMEQQMISQRIRDNYRARAEKCLPLGGVPPYGYNRDWTVNAKEAENVELIYRLLLRGMSLDSIARKMNSKGIESPSGGKWSGVQISRQLKNIAYAKPDESLLSWLKTAGYQILGSETDYIAQGGCIKVDRQGSKYAAKSAHEPIITSEKWLAAQDILLSRKPSANGGSGSTSWLQGFTLCGKCGSSCYVRSNGKGYPYIYMVCRGRRSGICSGLKALRTEQIEKAAGKALEKEIKRLLRPCTQTIDRELAALSQKPHRSGQLETNFDRMTLDQKKTAASLLIKNVVVTESETVIIFR